MMDNMSDMIYFKDRGSKFIMVNKAAAEWQGAFTPEEMVGKSDFDSYSEEDARRMRDEELHIMQTGEPLFGVEESETWKNGSQAWVSTTKMPLRNEVGDIIGIFGISRDITEHKNAEIRAAKYAEENRRFREELEDDLLMASQLQKTFFPASYPSFPSASDGKGDLVQFCHLHHAGGLIGGDLCSIRKLSDTEAGIFLCDVMGHGVRAALGTSIVRAMVEEISHQKKDPGQFLEHMNQTLMPLFRQDDLFLFATACYMVLDVSTGVLKVAAAGHPLPILLNASVHSVSGLVEDSCFSGPALAVTEEARYKTIECRLRPEDGVFMYTDGITEVVNRNEEEYGENRLVASARGKINLPMSGLFDALYEDACSFAAGAALEDDVCLVGFRLKHAS
ncbi:SpoIIE family protein phosphatase [Pontiella sulfatireligans]|nr:SpoIIE family protein phosphatase [Pontiella sulfatireligans]